jgi:ATP-dependent RNA helicase MSS116
LREFTDLAEQGLVDPTIIRAIVKDMKIKTMTDVQSQTLREILQGDDVLVYALALKALGPETNRASLYTV